MPFLKTNKRPYHYWKLFSQTNSSMTDLSVLYSKVNDLWLLYTSYIIIVLWSSLWPKHILSKPQNCFQNYFPGISYIFVICSSSQLCLAVYGVVIRSTASSKENSPSTSSVTWTIKPLIRHCSSLFLLTSYISEASVFHHSNLHNWHLRQIIWYRRRGEQITSIGYDWTKRHERFNW